MWDRLDEALHRHAYLGLQRLRGRPVGAFIRQLQAWERLDPAAFRRLSRERLREALSYAKSQVPLYSSDEWRRAHPDDLGSWPILERQTVRTRQVQLLARSRRPGTFYRHSSSTTGEPVHVALNPHAGAWSWANEYRAMLWHGVAPGVKTLMMWGGRHPLSDWIRNTRIFDTRDLTAAQLEAAAQFLIRNRVQLCAGLPSAIAMLGRYVRARHPYLPRRLVPFAKLGGEQVYDFQRDEIERHFGARTIEFYGCTEVGAIAAQCPRGAMHVFAEHVHLEIVQGDAPVPAGEFGDIVATSLVNRAMPLVRCRIGDRGRLSPEPCPCGLPHPILTDLVGRAADLFVTADGRRVHGSLLAQNLRPFLARVPPQTVQQVLFEQTDPTSWKVLVESGGGFDDALAAELADIIRANVGRTCEVKVECVSSIPREASGKYRYYRPPVRLPGQESGARG